jgi:hypothetical protein
VASRGPTTATRLASSSSRLPERDQSGQRGELARAPFHPLASFLSAQQPVCCGLDIVVRCSKRVHHLLTSESHGLQADKMLDESR